VGEKTVWGLSGHGSSREERRAKPETEQLLPRWGKSCVFLKPLAGAFLSHGFFHHTAFAKQGERKRGPDPNIALIEKETKL
jgi:hypothetical protein